MKNINLEMAKLESILIENPKFAKRWLEMLNNHQNGCPCKHFGYTNSKISYDMTILNCRFDCSFSQLLFKKSSKVWHLKSAITHVLETKKVSMFS